jgi:hypothetical protein
MMGIASTRRAPAVLGVPLWVVGLVLALAVISGFATAVGLKYTAGSAPQSGAWSGSESYPGNWTWNSTVFHQIPAVVTAASTAVATPTVLPAANGASYAINTTVKNHQGAYFGFYLATGLPASTEFELIFSIGLKSAPATIHVYLETASSGLTTALALTLIWDTGYAAVPATASLGMYSVTVDQCSAIGTCP